MARHLGANHRFVQTIQRACKHLALLQLQWLLVAVGKVLKIIGCGAQHRKATVRVAQAQGHHPRHRAVLRQGAHAVHRHGLRDAAQVKHRKQHQLHRAAASAHDQINATDRL